MNRIIKLTVALVLALSGFLVAGAATSGAQASEQRATTTQQAPHASARAGRSVELIFKRATRTAFKVRVKVSPAGGKKTVILQYKRTAGGSFHKIRKAKMNANGKAKLGRTSKLGYYRAVTKKSAAYDRSYSNVIRVYRA